MRCCAEQVLTETLLEGLCKSWAPCQVCTALLLSAAALVARTTDCMARRLSIYAHGQGVLPIGGLGHGVTSISLLSVD
jgi:hypothetical protein